MSAVSTWLLGRRWRAGHAVAVPVAVALLASVCGAPPPKPVQKEVVIWKNLGEWSGRGNAQTESFVGLTGSLRMHWRTKNEAPKEAGTFRLILHSAISGRALQEPVDQKGSGEGTAYTAEDPRVVLHYGRVGKPRLVVHSRRGALREIGHKPHGAALIRW